MGTTLRNKADSQLDASAEDSFTSEGGYLAYERDVPEKYSCAASEAHEPFPDFGTTLGRFAEGMRAALLRVRTFPQAKSS